MNYFSESVNSASLESQNRTTIPSHPCHHRPSPCFRAQVGEIIQDLCHFLNLKELESVADFPAEMKKFEEVLVQVDEYNSIRLKLTAEMADNSNLVKNLVIKVWVGDVLYVFVLRVCVWVSCYADPVSAQTMHTHVRTSHMHMHTHTCTYTHGECDVSIPLDKYASRSRIMLL